MGEKKESYRQCWVPPTSLTDGPGKRTFWGKKSVGHDRVVIAVVGGSVPVDGNLATR